MPHTRLIRLDDAEALCSLIVTNLAFLAPWEPEYPDGHFTAAGQRRSIDTALGLHAARRALPHVILDGDRIVGRITLDGIERGPFQSGHVGYWVGEADNGRGHASAGLAEICTLAFGELGLHRVEAGTLAHNAGSQRVLERNGFERFGLAPRYLKIAGTWQDHVLFQRLSDGA
jgi:[ribosomal protein S5]-alanine N-acetyltransferase